MPVWLVMGDCSQSAENTGLKLDKRSILIVRLQGMVRH